MEFPEITVESLKTDLKQQIDHEGITDEQLQELVRLIEIGEKEGRDDVDSALDFYNEIFSNHGIEAINSQDASPLDSRYYFDIALLYSNTGETYQLTLAYDTEAAQFLVTSWGDWFEEFEKEKNIRYDDEGNREYDSDETSSSGWNFELFDQHDNEIAQEDNEDEMYNAYSKAKSESGGKLTVLDISGNDVTQKFESMYQEELNSESKDDGIQEEFNRQFSMSYSEYLNEEDERKRDLTNDQAFSSIKKAYGSISYKLKNRYKVDWHEERGRATVWVNDSYTDESVWESNNDPIKLEGEFDDEGEQMYSEEGDIDGLIEGGWVKWGNDDSLLEYLYDNDIIRDFPEYAVLDREGNVLATDETDTPMMSDSDDEIMQYYCFFRLEHPDVDILVMKLDEDETQDFEHDFQEDIDYWKTKLESYK